MRQVDMTRLDLSAGTAIRMPDYVAEEVPLKIIVNSNDAFVIWCSPSQFQELAVGHLFAEDILCSADEIESITEDPAGGSCHIQLKSAVNIDERMENRRNGARVVPLIKSAASAYQHDEKLLRVKSALTVKAQTILDAIDRMNEKSNGFKKTGGLHCSGVFKADGAMVAFSEDVGRHNTVDKVIGGGLINHINFEECFMVITGRVPGDMIYKAAKAGLPVVASVSAILNSGASSAEKANITLIGFVRGKRMNIYTCSERIIL